MKNIFLSLLALPFLFLSIEASDKTAEVEKCLRECYRLNPGVTAIILEKISPLFLGEQYDSVIDTFIEESQKLEIYSLPLSKKGRNIIPFHPFLIFEDDYLRVSWTITKSDQQEPPQAHPYKTLLLVVEPSEFYCEDSTGNIYKDTWPVGVYSLDPTPHLMASRNIGKDTYYGLAFEIKGISNHGPYTNILD